MTWCQVPQNTILNPLCIVPVRCCAAWRTPQRKCMARPKMSRSEVERKPGSSEYYAEQISVPFIPRSCAAWRPRHRKCMARYKRAYQPEEMIAKGQTFQNIHNRFELRKPGDPANGNPWQGPKSADQPEEMIIKTQTFQEYNNQS